MQLLKLAAIVWVTCVGLAGAQTVDQGVYVTGEGRVASAPDMATITLGVRENAPSAKGAMAKVSASVVGILDQLDTLGIAPKDRQTSGFYLRPLINQNQPSSGDQKPVVVSYDAGNTVTVRVRDLDGLEALLGAMIEEGANDFNGLHFGLQDSSGRQTEARALAVKDAQDRAMQLAQAAGITLGSVLKMSEISHDASPMIGRMAAEPVSMSGAITTGEVEVRSQVTMVFAIAPLRR